MSAINLQGYQANKDFHPTTGFEDDGWTSYIVEQSEGVRPALAVYPHRSLPVCGLVRSVGDYIVIPKGKIVSLITSICEPATGSEGAEVAIGLNPNSWETDGAWSAPMDPSGQKPLSAMDQTSLPLEYTAPVANFSNFNMITDDTFGGYPKEVGAILTYANGGKTLTTNGYQYGSNDIGRTPLASNPANVVTATTDKTGTINANKPIGISHQDLYADVKGHWLSWQNQAAQTFLTDWYIRVPYVNLWKLDAELTTLSISMTSASLLTDNCLTANPLYKTSRLWAFAYQTEDDDSQRGTGSVDCTEGNVASGSTMYADQHGNYIFHPAGSTISEGAISYPTAKVMDEQKVGKVVYIDHRYPKQMLEHVDTYPASGAGAGTETAGLPWHSFTFAKDLLLNEGVTLANRQINDIGDMFKDGIFGMAYIQLHVS